MALIKIDTGIDGLFVLEPDIWGDDRGYFFESFQQARYEAVGINCVFVQDNEAYSNKGVVRGLHYQIAPYAQSKLVRVVRGEVLDVAVDIRPASPTYGQHYTVKLSGENKRQFFVPPGFAHGYVALTDDVYFVYKCDAYYAKEYEAGIKFDDPALGIDWILAAEALIVSEKDQQLPAFGDHLNFSH